MPHPQAPAFFCCPQCESAELDFARDLERLPAPFAVTEGLRCRGCRREYPHVQGVWVLWSDEVKALQLKQELHGADLHVRVKQANIDVYDEAAEHYDEHSQRRHLECIGNLKQAAHDFMATRGDQQPRVTVDVGCATGIGMEIGSEQYDYVVGVDISLSNLLRIQKPRYTMVLADAEKLPFRAGSIDLISCFAAMHHFPDPQAFLSSAQRCLRPGGACVTGADPSRAAMKMSPLARFVFNLRRPVYRLLASVSSRFYLHKDTNFQELNDLAEYQRTRGGFARGDLDRMYRQAGFTASKVFIGSEISARRKYLFPGWKPFLLKALSLQNPWLIENYASISALGRK